MQRLQLTRLGLNRSQDQGSFVGDRCPVCQEAGKAGVIGVYTTKREAGKVIRYLQCKLCGWKPNDNKWVEVDPAFKGDLRGQKRLPFDQGDESQGDSLADAAG